MKETKDTKLQEQQIRTLQKALKEERERADRLFSLCKQYQSRIEKLESKNGRTANVGATV